MNNKGITGFELGFLLTALSVSGITVGVPQIRHSFQEKRAIEICEFRGEENCAEDVGNMSKEDILDYIRDDEGNEDFYSHRATNKRGGGLRRRILAMQ